MQNDDIGEGKFPHVARGSVRSPAATYAPQETASDVFLPPIQASASVNHTSPSSSTPCVHVPQLIAEVPQSHCRPKLYPPSTYDATEPTQLKSNGLRLEQSYCFGYSGELKKLTAPTGSCRALGGSVSRNIFWLSNSIIMYPSAALVVLLATSGAHETKQCLFNGHTEEVTAVTIFPTGHTAASGQSGKYPRVIVWKYEGHMRALQCGEQCEAKRCIILDINLDVSYRGVNNLSFSSDGNFLVVVASDDNHTLLLYEMTASSAEKHTPVLSLKLGHAEVLNFCFNYYQFSPFSWTAAAQSIIPGNSNSPMKSRSENGNHIARNNVIKGEQSFCDTNKAWELAEGCYTLFSCMSRSLKLWTLYKYKELADPGVVEVSGFKGRRMSMPKHMQQWITRYHLRGFLCPLPKSSAPFEVTSCCAVSDAAEEIKSTNTRFFCGTTSGCIIVWRQTEVTKIDEITSMLSPASRSKALSKKPSMNCPQTKCWLPKGQFLYVITDVHDGSIYDIDVSKQFDLDQTLYTCGRDCVVNMWKILPAVGAQDRNQIPIQHLKSIPFNWKRGDEKVGDSRDKDPAEALLNEPLEGIGRFIAISPDDTVAIIGLSSNGLYRVRCPGFSLSNTTLTASNITVDAIMLGHSGSILRVVQHPVSDIFVTLATDRSVRVWSLSKKQQLSTTYIRDDSLSSICFSPNGKHIAVGTATYGNVLFFDLNFENGKASPENYKIDAVDLILVRRKKVFSKRHKPKKPDKLDHENMVSNDCHVPEVIDREAAIVARNIQRLPGKKDAEIVDVCYSPDSTVLAVACKNGSIYLLSAEVMMLSICCYILMTTTYT